jgi:hypothetical protein
LAVNHKENRFAWGAGDGGIYRFYKMEGQKPELLSEIVIGYPVYEFASLKGGGGPVYQNDNRISTLDATSTDRYFYFLDCGTIFSKDPDGPRSKANKVLVFDSDGSPVCIIRLDRLVQKIDVLADDSALICFTSNPETAEPEFVRYELPDFNE